MQIMSKNTNQKGIPTLSTVSRNVPGRTGRGLRPETLPWENPVRKSQYASISFTTCVENLTK